MGHKDIFQKDHDLFVTIYAGIHGGWDYCRKNEWLCIFSAMFANFIPHEGTKISKNDYVV